MTDSIFVIDKISIQNNLLSDVIHLFDLNYLTKKEIVDIFFLNNLNCNQLMNNKYLYLLFYNLINTNKINIFTIIFKKCTNQLNNNIITEIFTKLYKIDNCIQMSRQFSLIERCFNLNRLLFIKQIIENLGIIGDNYYNLLFSNLHYALFNQKAKLNVLYYLNDINYKPTQTYSYLNISNYTSKFLDVWKYEKNNNIHENINEITPLHNLAKIKHFSKIQIYIDYFNNHKVLDLNSTDIYNKTPIIYAIEYNNLEYCKYLLDNKCDILHLDKFKCNIFHYACIQDNTYDNNIFFCKLWNLLKYDLRIESLLLQKNIKGYTPIEYILHKGRFIIYRNIYFLKYIRCSNSDIDLVQTGFSHYFNKIQKYNKYMENTYQFKEYLKLIKLLIRECMDIRVNDVVSNVKNSDVFYKVCKYLER